MNQKIYVTIQDLSKFEVSGIITYCEELPENPNYKFEKIIEIISMNGYDIYVYDEDTELKMIERKKEVIEMKKRGLLDRLVKLLK